MVVVLAKLYTLNLKNYYAFTVTKKVPLPLINENVNYVKKA